MREQSGRTVAILTPGQVDYEAILSTYRNTMEESAVDALMWEELQRLIEVARLTENQGVVLRLWLQGFSLPAVGRLYPNPKTGRPRDKQTIDESLKASQKKITKLNDLGCLDLIISRGWDFARAYFTESRAVADFLNTKKGDMELAA